MKKISLKLQILLGAMALVLPLQAAAPGRISYQGKLADSNGVPLNNTFSMVFAICDAPTGGTCSYTENTGSVAVTNGLFNVVVGQVTPIDPALFATGAARYLEVRVDGNPFLPRHQLVAAPYALAVAAGSVADTDLAPAFLSSIARFGGNNLSLPNTGNLVLSGGGKVTGLGSPTLGSDAATKQYVDSATATVVRLTAGNLSLPSAADLILSGGGRVRGLPGTFSFIDEAVSKQYVDSATATVVRFTAGDLPMPLSGNLILSGGGRVTGLPGTFSLADEAVSKQYVDTATSSVVRITGGNATLPSGANLILIGGGKVTGLGSPSAATDAATKQYVDTATSTVVRISGGNVTLPSGANLILIGGGKVTGLGSPSAATDATTKQYVDVATNAVAALAAGPWERSASVVSLETVGDAVAVGGPAVATKKLTVVGDSDFNGDLRVRADLTVDNNLNVDNLTVGGGQVVSAVLTASTSLSFGNINSVRSVSRTMTVTGAVAGDVVVLGPPSGLTDGLMATAVVEADNTVRVTVFNGTGSTINSVTGVFRATVIRH